MPPSARGRARDGGKRWGAPPAVQYTVVREDASALAPAAASSSGAAPGAAASSRPPAAIHASVPLSSSADSTGESTRVTVWSERMSITRTPAPARTARPPVGHDPQVGDARGSRQP